MLHVWMVLEKLPLHLWSIEGAKEALRDKVIIDRLDSRTFERINTKLFAIWVWMWELAHIPTRRTLWKHARGAGRVEEMLGFSPPKPRSSATSEPAVLGCGGSPRPQQGLDTDVPTLLPLHAKRPAILGRRRPPIPSMACSWWLEQRDGRRALRGVADPRTREPARMASSSCTGLPTSGTRRDHDGDDREGRGKTWKGALLGRSPNKELAPTGSSSGRHRSRTPTSRHR
ncbi:d-3-phosphoglycerate chloroplastic [Hordeum vulgare]|nr:d-3-phosphoglycerate chloroplastic [Hordeum vulgare]